jgi:hypothetical protein
MRHNMNYFSDDSNENEIADSHIMGKQITVTLPSLKRRSSMQRRESDILSMSPID